MYTVKDVMSAVAATNEPYAILQTETVFKALQVMADKNVGAVTVVDENGRIVGIFTERDYARKIILLGRCSLDTQLKEIMTREMITVHPETTIDECMALMSKFRIRHLPVMDQGTLIGMVSMRDVVDAIIASKQTTIENLQNYILGQGYVR